MSMKKKMIAQKKEKGIEAMASLGTKVTANKRLKTGMKKKSKANAFILGIICQCTKYYGKAQTVSIGLQKYHFAITFVLSNFVPVHYEH